MIDLWDLEICFCRSHEERKLLMLKVGRSSRGGQTRAVWVDGGIHARYESLLQIPPDLSFYREWIAVATATFLLDKIVEVFKTNDTRCIT